MNSTQYWLEAMPLQWGSIDQDNLHAWLDRVRLDAWKQGMTDAKFIADLHGEDNSDIGCLIEIRRDATNSL